MTRAEHIEERIRWRLGRGYPSLPIGRTFFFEQLPDSIRNLIADLTATRAAGTPVVVAWDSPDQWTMIGTTVVLSSHSGRLHECPLTAIADLHMRDPIPNDLPHEEASRRKATWEHLRLTDRTGSFHDIWLPAGNEAFALWSTLLMLGRMCGMMSQISLGPIPDSVRDLLCRLIDDSTKDGRERDERLGYPVTGGPGGCSYLSANGDAWILRFGFEEQEDDTIELLEDGPRKVGLVVIAAERVSEFRDWLPRRLPRATDCSVCDTTGHLPPPYSLVQCVKCYGLGWLLV